MFNWILIPEKYCRYLIKLINSNPNIDIIQQIPLHILLINICVYKLHDCCAESLEYVINSTISDAVHDVFNALFNLTLPEGSSLINLTKKIEVKKIE